MEKGKGTPTETVLYPARAMPVSHRVDVLVAGGGTSGVAAAVAAARQGARTLLVERYGFVGGTAVGSPVPVFQEGPLVGGQPVIRGIYAEQKARLAEYNAIVDGPGIDLGLGRATGSGFFEAAMLQLICFEMCQEAGVELLLHTYLADVLKDGDVLRQALVVNKGGLSAIAAQQFVDCTADGDLAVAGGAHSQTGRPVDGMAQPPTLVFELGNIEMERLAGVDWDALWPIFAAECPEVVIARNRIFFERIPGRLRFGSMTHVPGIDAADPADRTRAEIAGRRQAKQVMDFFRRHVPGCQACSIVFFGVETGIRESRRIIGDYIITRQDVLGCRKFPDAVGCSTSWIDLHNPEGTGVLHEFLPRDDWFEIPYRALVTAGLANLYTASRCVSCTHEALGALRTIPTGIMLGEAAGTAAALAARSGVGARQVEVSEVQANLIRAGAFLGSPKSIAAPPPPAT